MEERMIRILSIKDKPIQAVKLKELYRQAGWWPERDKVAIKKMLEASSCFGAWNEEELIGFVRLIHDGTFRGYIEDVLVHPLWRKRGIAEALLELVKQDFSGLDIISLFCEEELIPYYQKLGFKVSRSQNVLHLKNN